jgi:hypothetical protein
VALLVEPVRRPARRRPAAGRRVLIGVLLSIAPLADAAGQPRQPPTEQEVKAVFLFHFTRFVTWPPNVLADRERPFAICIFGDDPFAETLEAVVAGERVEGKPIRIVRSVSASQAPSCQLLYVTESREGPVRSLLDRLAAAPVLTVGESEQFLDHGGMVRFVTRRNRVQLEIDPDTTARAGLKVSSRLLSLARRPPGKPR